MSQKVSDFKAVKLQLASSEEILSWSHGEVLKPETINYRTQRYEKDGLFCEKIFGPSKDWECYCGKYKRIRYKGVVCDKCGVEVTRSIVRRERMGHISLAVPVAHIWYLKGTPSRIGLLLDMTSSDLEKVVYFASYVIIEVNEEAKKEVLDQIEREYKTKVKELKKEMKDTKELKKIIEEVRESKKQSKDIINSLKPKLVISENEYRKISLKYGHVFEAGIGAEAIQKLLQRMDLETEVKRIDALLKADTKGIDKKKLMRRLRIIKGMNKAGIRPEWMLAMVVPVIPPDLRPMVQLDGGRYATSDLNDLYRRIINRNNRLKKLLLIGAPEVICRNEKRMLQEAVDALFDNSARRSQVSVLASTGQRRPLKSLADMLKGKQGRFRQNLLGKRVDYSGRSVIVVGADLKIDQCGLPKKMALELYKPFIIEKLIKRGLAHNVRSAGRLVEQEATEAYEILEEVIKDHYVLLNRAPTLHRLGIQAFQPVLIEGKAIRVHPLVCAAFNADFDGDQMAVHLPLTKEARIEAKDIMVSRNNILKPSTGEPIAIPTLDIVLGIYYMTDMNENKKGAKVKKIASFDQAVILYEMGKIGVREKIEVQTEDNEIIETCVGRILVNRILPKEIGFVNKVLNKKALKQTISKAFRFVGMAEIAKLVDNLKDLGFAYATKSGISWGMNNLQVPKSKKRIIKEAASKINEVDGQYDMGLLTDDERKAQVISIWNECRDKIAEEVEKHIDREGPVYTMVNSGARGSMSVLVQLMGMRGLMANPKGDIIELPVRDSFKEGLNVLEYFNSSHGARKGMADTALRTATAGYLTRRLVDVAQDVIISEDDCATLEGAVLYREDSEAVGSDFAFRLEGRIALKDIIDPKSKQLIVKAGEMITKSAAEKIDQAKIEQIEIRSAVYCKSPKGICRKCYGHDLGKNELVKLGQAVGVIAAQSIGEPGTQLTMRTFHAGGVAGEDIVSGLPRVEEIFEARFPKGEAVISEIDGKVKEITEEGNQKQIVITPDKPKSDSKVYTVASNVVNLVNKGDLVYKGQQLVSGHIDLKKLFKLSGIREVHRYIIKEIQEVYASQGESIDDKHIEIIIRQMFSRVKVVDPGDTDLITGDIIELNIAEEINKDITAKGHKPAKIERMILGITKVSLSTDSFLSAASFMHTAQVLIKASLLGKVDHLRGLKENVILGKLIPAGTGYDKEILKPE
ncbi:MAG: DNA-directed RNA polymerase subunit beta' [Candidatus Moranbacteria bacterium]|nr:DNA-directed RNA polymerase subunit beta' [Candidatus Moranbacteria bacterium]